MCFDEQAKETTLAACKIAKARKAKIPYFRGLKLPPCTTSQVDNQGTYLRVFTALDNVDPRLVRRVWVSTAHEITFRRNLVPTGSGLVVQKVVRMLRQS